MVRLTVDFSGPTVSVRTTVPELEPRRLYLAWSRDRALAPVRMASLYLAGVVLLAGGALVESFVSGAL